MASDQSALLNKEPPLSFMQALSPTVAYYEPPASASSAGASRNGPGPGPDPELIVMLSWSNASDMHIAKYISQYRALFPSSRVLLVRSPLLHNAFPVLNTAGVNIAAAVVQSVVGSQGTAGRARVLVHVFSNGGMNTAAKLYKVLGETASVPRHALLLDSCPGYYRYESTYRAATVNMPWFFKPLIHLLMVTLTVIGAAMRKPPHIDSNAAAVNMKELAKSQVQRAYLYGTEDAMVDWRDVEDHATKAGRNGFLVRTEKFEGGKHVAQVRVNPDRYWRVVKETWETGIQI
jgi:hypothetical protein